MSYVKLDFANLIHNLKLKFDLYINSTFYYNIFELIYVKVWFDIKGFQIFHNKVYTQVNRPLTPH